MLSKPKSPWTSTMGYRVWAYVPAHAGSGRMHETTAAMASHLRKSFFSTLQSPKVDASRARPAGRVLDGDGSGRRKRPASARSAGSRGGSRRLGACAERGMWSTADRQSPDRVQQSGERDARGGPRHASV